VGSDATGSERSTGAAVISYVFALLGAIANATGNVLNRKASRDEPAEDRFSLRLVTDLLRTPTWLAAVGFMTLSFILAGVALATGELASVQFIVILELPLTLIGGSWMLGARLGRREWAAVVAMTAGVLGLLAILDPRPGSSSAVPPILWILASAANGGALIAVYLAARAQPIPAVQAALLGVAAGLGYGLTAAFTKGFADLYSVGGLAAIFSSWQLYACVSSGLTSVWLLQNAYNAGTLAAAQPGITLVDPVISTCWGVLVFGENVREGPILWLTALPLIALCAGAVMLSRSPVLHATQGRAGAEGSAGDLSALAGEQHA
jgi:drug/metabolite transporter (DMT)-like permease